MRSDVSRYYTYINRAELYVTDNNYSLACSDYDSAFRIGTVYPFSADIYHDAVCETRLGNYHTAVKRLKFLIENGFSLQTLRNAKSLQALFLSTEGKDFLVKAGNMPLHKGLDTSLKLRIGAIIQADRYYRKSDNYYSIYKRAVDSIDRDNSDKLLSIINRYKFPTEYLIGIDSGSLYMQGIYTVIIHQCAGPRQMYNFSKELLEALNQGNINNRAGAYLIERSNGSNDIYGCTMTRYVLDSLISFHEFVALSDTELLSLYKDAFYAFPQLSAETKNLINQRRQNIGLDDIDNTRRKIRFCLKDRAFNFYPYSLSTYLMVSKKMYDNFIKNLVPL